jgi:hypothetical protein
MRLYATRSEQKAEPAAAFPGDTGDSRIPGRSRFYYIKKALCCPVKSRSARGFFSLKIKIILGFFNSPIPNRRFFHIPRAELGIPEKAGFA